MAKIVIVGAGLAGLSAAVKLCKNHQITVIEKTNRPGGRIKNVFNTVTNNYYDIGQHILLSAYHNTFELLEILDVEKKFYCINNLEFFENNKVYQLKLSNNFFPFGLLLNILKSRLFHFGNILDITKFIQNLKEKKINEIKNNDLYDFINLFAVSIFNTNLEYIEKSKFVNTLKIIAKKNNFMPILPKVTLQELLVDPAENYLIQNNVNIIYNQKVTKFDTINNKISKIYLQNYVLDDFDTIIWAVPYNEYFKIFPCEQQVFMNDIFTAYFFTEKPVNLKMLGNLNDSLWDWMFAYGNIISFVKSSYNGKNIDINILKNLLFRMFDDVKIIDYKLLNYKNATPVQNDLMNNNISTNYNLINSYVIGDWIYQDMPATIETAVKSGFDVIKKIN